MRRPAEDMREPQLNGFLRLRLFEPLVWQPLFPIDSPRENWRHSPRRDRCEYLYQPGREVCAELSMCRGHHSPCHFRLQSRPIAVHIQCRRGTAGTESDKLREPWASDV